MRKLLAGSLISCLSFLLAIPAAGQTSRPAAQPAPPQDLPIPLITLKAVQDVRERNVKWQETADLALSEVKNEAMRKQINQRLSSVAQQAAADLLAKPDSQAIVTIAIYRTPQTHRQALAAVAYEGRSDHLSQGFYSRVISDLPAAPVVRKDQEKLVLDELATCYLCFFLDHGNLDAGRIPHPLMKQSIERAAQSFLAKENEGMPQLAGASQAPAGQPAAAQPSTNSPSAAPANNGPAYNSPLSGPYANPNGLYDGYAYSGYWSPWVAYYPGAAGQPVIVTPQTQPSKNAQPQNPTTNPTGVVQRDPKTGQPLPPESQRDKNQPAPAQQTPQQNINAVLAPAARSQSKQPAPSQATANSQKQSPAPPPTQQKSPPPAKESPKGTSTPPPQKAPSPPPANNKPSEPAGK